MHRTGLTPFCARLAFRNVDNFPDPWNVPLFIYFLQNPIPPLSLSAIDHNLWMLWRIRDDSCHPLSMSVCGRIQSTLQLCPRWSCCRLKLFNYIYIILIYIQVGFFLGGERVRLNFAPNARAYLPTVHNIHYLVNPRPLVRFIVSPKQAITINGLT